MVPATAAPPLTVVRVAVGVAVRVALVPTASSSVRLLGVRMVVMGTIA
jgi:hypothetical protein